MIGIGDHLPKPAALHGSSAMIPAYLSVFGGLSLTDAASGQLLGSPKRKPLAVLAVLAVAGDRGLERDALASLLWSEQDDVRARRSLAQALYALRQEMGDREAVEAAGRIRLSTRGLTSDLDAFERSAPVGGAVPTASQMAELVTCYHGPFLDGVYFPGCASFEQWSESHRARYERRFVSAVFAFVTQQPEANDGLTILESAILRVPHSAQLALVLARVLARNGRNSEAEAVLVGHSASVRQLHDEEPSAEIVQAIREVRATVATHDFSKTERPHGSRSWMGGDDAGIVEHTVAADRSPLDRPEPLSTEERQRSQAKGAHVALDATGEAGPSSQSEAPRDANIKDGVHPTKLAATRWPSRLRGRGARNGALLAVAIGVATALASLVQGRTPAPTSPEPTTITQMWKQRYERQRADRRALFDSTHIGRVLILPAENATGEPSLDSLLPIIASYVYRAQGESFAAAIPESLTTRLVKQEEATRNPTSTTLQIKSVIAQTRASLAIRPLLIRTVADSLVVNFFFYRVMPQQRSMSPGHVELEGFSSPRFAGIGTNVHQAARTGSSKLLRFLVSLETCRAADSTQLASYPWCWGDNRQLRMLSPT